MQKVLELAQSAAATESFILLLGESGSGKEVIADYIHQHSRRSGEVIVKVNCGALPEHLMESELFGHEKGAFTGAEKRSIGRFEKASGGTLFLDEIGDLLPHLQVKLLRALQDRIIERVGSGAPVNVDFRLICATHRDLSAAVAEGRFREDLYYRINVVPIRVPPLRERVEDIEPLVTHFLRSLGQALPKAPSGFSAEALQALQAFSWPGNVRQLRNAVEYALVVCKEPVIGTAALPEEVREGRASPSAPPVARASPPAGYEVARASPPAGQAGTPAPPAAPGTLKETVEVAEEKAILAALQRHHWRVTAVARELGISRSRLYERMDAYGIKRPE